MSATRELLGSAGGEKAEAAAWPLLAAALEASGDGLIILRVDPEAPAIVFCNRALADLIGFSAAEVLRQDPFFFCDELHRRQLTQSVVETVNSGLPQRLVVPGNGKNGGIFFARVVLRRLSVAGAVRYVAATFVDVTEQSEIDAAMRQLPSTVMVLSTDFKIRYANEAAAQAVDSAPEKIIGRSLFEVMPHVEVRREHYERALAGESLDFYGVKLRRPDGSVVVLDTRLRPQRDVSGRVTGLVVLAENVTAQHHASQRLEASEHWLRTITETSNDIIVVLSADGRIKSLAGNYLQVFGVTQAERVGRNSFDFVHPEDAPRVARMFEQLAATPGERMRDEFRLRRPDGSVRWVDVVSVNMLDEPTVEGIVVNLRDGTERRQAELALAEARKHFDLAVACAALALWDCDVPTRTLTWNDEWYRILGVDPEVGRGTVERMEDGVHPDDVAGYMQSLEECWRGPNDHWERQLRVRTAASEWKWIFDRGRVVERDATGRALRMAGVSIDIDAHQRAETALKESESRFATSLWGSQVGFWEYDIIRDAMLWWNDWCETVDIEPCTGGGHTPRWDELTHPDDLEVSDAAWFALVENRSQVYEAEFRLKTGAGEWRWLQSRARAIERDAEGRALRVVGVTLDVDGRKCAEIALREAEQQLELAVQGAQLPVWSWDMKRDRVRSNQHWYRVRGIDVTQSESERLEYPWLHGVHPDDIGRMQQAVSAHISGEQDYYECEYRNRTASDGWKWLLDRGKVVEWDENGVPGRMSGVAIDIDERKRMETALRERDAQLAAALWGSDIGLWDWDCRTDTIEWLSDWCERFGFEACEGEDHYDSWLKRIHPDDLGSAIAAFDSHISGPKDAYETDYRLRNRTGEWRWVHERGQVLSRDPAGRATRVVGVCFDINERRCAEQNLRETQARLELTVWGSQVGFWDWNLEVEDTRWINDWCRTLDLDPCDGPNHVERWDERIHPDDCPEAQRRFAAALSGASDFYEAEYRVLTLFGRWHWIHERGRVVSRSPDGRALRMAGICMDIDARKHTETTLRETEARLGTALWSAGIAYWDWDLVRDVDKLSEHWFAMTGYSRSSWEHEQDPWRRRVHPDDLARADSALRSHIGGQAPIYEAEYRLRVAAGEWKWLLDRGRIVERDAHGLPTKLSGTSIDIDARKRTERELELSEYRYRTVAALSPGFVQELVPTPDGRFQLRWVSEGFEQIFGAKLDEIGAIDGVFARYHPDDRAALPERIKALYDGQRLEAEIRIFDGRGEMRWLHVVNQPFTDLRSGQVTSVIGVCHDITDRKLAEQALRESEYRYRTVAQISPGFVQEFRLMPDGEDVLTWVSEGFIEVFGCTLDEMTARGGPKAFYHRDDVENARLRMADLVAGRTSEAEVRMLNARGETRWLHVVNQPIAPLATTGGKRDGLYVIGVCQDITARKKAELALQKSESILRSVTDNVPDWLLLVDLDLRTRFANRAFLARTPAEFVGQSVLQLVPPADRERLASILEYAVRSSNSISTELTIPAEDEQRHFEVRAAPVIEQSAVAGLTVSITEITQRRLAETTLRTQATILETMREGVAVIARDGIVRLTNPAVERMFGYGPGEVVGLSTMDLLGDFELSTGELDRLDFLERHRRQPLKRDFKLKRKDGTLFTGEAVMTSLELGLERVWLAVVQDITERKGLEHEIIEIANREQQRIGSDLHDGLGQELTGVALMLRGLSSKIRKSDPRLEPDVEEIVVLVNHTIESARSLARGLSPVSLDRGGLVFALRSLAARAREMYGVDVRMRSRVWPELALDEPTANHLYRIAQEAVTNAVRHGQASQISVQLLVEERNVRLTITDNGVGLDVGPADETRHGAAGMGLKIMAYRARMIDGEVTVERLREGGTRVRCRYRQPPPKHPAIDAATDVPDPSRACSIGASPGEGRSS